MLDKMELFLIMTNSGLTLRRNIPDLDTAWKVWWTNSLQHHCLIKQGWSRGTIGDYIHVSIVSILRKTMIEKTLGDKDKS